MSEESVISKNFCKNVITIPQFTGTCWFNSLLTILLFSDGMRYYLKKYLSNSKINKKSKIYIVFNDLLNNHYLKNNDLNKVYFNQFKPENILKILYKENSKVFNFNPDIDDGLLGEIYFMLLLKYFGFEKNIVYMSYKNDDYSVLYDSFFNYDPDLKNINGKKQLHKSSLKMKDIFLKYYFNMQFIPEIIVISNLLSFEKLTFIKNGLNKNKLPKILTYNNHKYKLDSLLLVNFNKNICKKSHQIAGITCKNKQYMYNGWIINTKDPSNDKFIKHKEPCELMKYNWIDNTDDFCISRKLCKLDEKKHDDMCFNVDKGNRTFFYVKIDNNSKINSPPNIISKTKCPSDKILNPKTNRCVSKTGKIGKQILNQNLSPIPENKIKCPSDKILNPKTNRCVLKTGKIGKELLKK